MTTICTMRASLPAIKLRPFAQFPYESISDCAICSAPFVVPLSAPLYVTTRRTRTAHDSSPK